MAEDEQREDRGERDKQAEEVADDRCQGGDGEHCEHSEHEPDKAAYLNGEETFLDIALKGEEHDVADEDQPAVGKTDDVQDRICDSYYLGKRNISSEYDPTGAYNFSAWKDKLDDNVRSNYEKLHETLLYTDEKQNLDDAIETFEHIAKQLEQIGE